MKTIKAISILLIAALMAGSMTSCTTTTANYPMRQTVKPEKFIQKGGSEQGIYLHRKGTFPNESPIWATIAALGVKDDPNAATPRVIPPEVIAAAVGAVAEIGTKLSEYQKDIRNGNVAGSQEAFFWGYQDPSQLEALMKILEAWDKASELPMP